MTILHCINRENYKAIKTKQPTPTVIMKKENIKFLLFALLLSTSIGSYVFLNMTAATQEQSVLQSNPDELEQGTIMPDAMFIIKVMDKARQLLPAS